MNASSLFRCAAALAVLAIGGVAGCKEVTEAVVEKGVKAAKDTTKGIADGIDKGRKEGESADGAFVVSTAGDLAGKGSIAVRALRPRVDDPKRAEIELAIENTTDRPLRLSGVEVLALDREGFVKRPDAEARELTVPAHAKDLLVLSFAAEPSTLAKIRIWGADSPLPAPSAAAPAP